MHEASCIVVKKFDRKFSTSLGKVKVPTIDEYNCYDDGYNQYYEYCRHHILTFFSINKLIITHNCIIIITSSGHFVIIILLKLKKIKAKIL